jgi:hypothetical protein
MKFILLALHDSEKLTAVLDAWEQAGVGGATILPSTGLGRIRRNGALREDLPIMPSLDALFTQVENLSHTLFSVVDDRLVADIVTATQNVVGDLSKPDTGILIVMPVEQAYGLEKTPDG